MSTTYILSPTLHNALVAAAYRHRGYTADEAAAGARFSELTAWHGIKTHNAIKALHLDERSRPNHWPGAQPICLCRRRQCGTVDLPVHRERE